MSEVKELRAKTGLTQTKFGKLFHIPMRTIQNWENGTNKPPEWAIYLLEIAVNQYFEEEKTMKKYENCGIITYENEEYMLTDSASSGYEYNSSDWTNPNNWFRHWAYKIINGKIECDKDDDPILYEAWYYTEDTEDEIENINFENPNLIKKG